MKRWTIGIVSFSEVKNDARVLRQIKYLSSSFNLVVIGFGDEPKIDNRKSRTKWLSIKPKETILIKGNTYDKKALRLILRLKDGDYSSIKYSFLYRLGLLSRFSEKICKLCYWANNIHKDALRYAINEKCDAYLANDWDALPVVGEAARQTNSKFIFDAHEYSLGQRQNFFYRMYNEPIIAHSLNKYLPHADAFVTVGSIIGERYQEEYNVIPQIIRNAPEYCDIDLHPMTSSKINIVHHGVASPRRHLEGTIQAIGLSDKKFHLHLMLVEKDPVHLKKLKKMAHDVAPDRIHFHEPVAPSQIVRRISEYDLGICVFPPVTYNLNMALPNKFFDFIQAGLAVITGPSPEMAKIAREYGIGKVTSSFSPADVAETLNALKIEEIEEMRLSARKAAQEFHAEKEHEKLIRIFRTLFEITEKNSENV